MNASPPAPDDDRLNLRVIGGIFAATLLSFIGFAATLPVLPRYVTGPLGGGDVAVGVVIGCYTLSGMLYRPFAARRSDRVGRRPVAVMGMWIVALGASLLFVPAGVIGLVVARLVLGVGIGATNAIMNIWLSDAAPPTRRAEAIGMLGVAIWGGMAIGPILGELLLNHVSYEAVWALAVAAPLAALLIVRRIPDARVPDATAPRGPLVPRAAIAPGIALLLANIGWGTAAAFVVLHVTERGIGGGVAVLSAYGIAVVCTRLLLGWLPDRLGHRRTAVGGGMSQAVGLGLLALSPSIEVAVAGGIVLGLGTSLVYPSLVVIVIDRAHPSERGAAIGAFTSFFDLGVGIGAPMAGVVAALAGYEAAFWLAAGCTAAGALVGAVVGAPGRRAPAHALAGTGHGG